MKINYAAVVVSAVAYWMLGGLWYGLLFTAPYRELENLGLMPAGMNAASAILRHVSTGFGDCRGHCNRLQMAQCEYARSWHGRWTAALDRSRAGRLHSPRTFMRCARWSCLRSTSFIRSLVCA